MLSNVSAQVAPARIANDQSSDGFGALVLSFQLLEGSLGSPLDQYAQRKVFFVIEFNIFVDAEIT